MKRGLLAWIALALLTGSSVYGGQRNHTVYFEGEENELHVYRIIGNKPGKTLLIIGGIQGDEPGGFLAADFYADFSLEVGSLIVVPRANFPSILKNERQINQDMNRKFADDNAKNYEGKVVAVLKKLICESDCFLNLHEGSGIYSPQWESETRNPKKFGQSIIADDSILDRGGDGNSVDLGEMASQVIERINRNIKDPKHRFHFNNHRTNQPNTIHKEQRRSATYYALNTCKIPAFGVESAKALPLEQKVRQHIYAINGFMDLLGIVPETPGINLKKPEMQYMIISVNENIPVVVGTMQRLKIKKGDRIQVHDIVANYERGLSVDIIGAGNEFNDMKKKVAILESTRIVARKDSYACGSVFVDVVEEQDGQFQGITLSQPPKTKVLKYKFKVNGTTVIKNNFEILCIRRGDQVGIVDIISGDVDPSEYVVNFKGFVGNHSKNNGEDRGYLIDTGRNVLIPRYSLGKQGKEYLIVTTLNGKEVGKIYVEIQS
ncbi:MAG: M14/M99 family metallopeptidase [Desulfobacterales bacterium]|nr:M14/M99 family metallopeptidase [Desulfobacterales bacterium]